MPHRSQAQKNEEEKPPNPKVDTFKLTPLRGPPNVR